MSNTFLKSINNPKLQRLGGKCKLSAFKLSGYQATVIANALSCAPHFSPHADKLTVETSFAVLSEHHLQSNHLLHCLSEHICPQYTYLLVQIQSDFSSLNIGPFASRSKNLGDRLSIYKFDNIKFVLLDSRQIIPPQSAVPNLLNVVLRGGSCFK